MIIRPGLDGLLAATFLHHYLGWPIAGYYDDESLWLSPAARENWDRLVWVDLDICRPGCRSIGHQVLTKSSTLPAALKHCCNPNLLAGLGAVRFDSRYPFSTVLFLLWLYNKPLRRSLVSRLLVLAAGSSWIQVQQYPDKCREWWKRLPGYDWDWLFTQVDGEQFERRMRDQLLAPLERLTGRPAEGNARSIRLDLPGLDLRFNPDWDEDLLLKVGAFAGTHLKWSPPRPATTSERIEGRRQAIAVDDIAKHKFPAKLIAEGAFSYAFTGTDTVNFTTFPKEV